MTRHLLPFAIALALSVAALPVSGQTVGMPDAFPGVGFGSSASISDDEIYLSSAPIGWPSGDEGPSALLVFRRDEAQGWVEHARLAPSDGKPGDHFGRSIYVDESLLVVGAPGIGAAYVFERDASGTWKETGTLSPSSLSDSAEFAGAGDYAALRPRAIERVGDRIAVVSYAASPTSAGSYPGAPSKGAVHVFRKEGEEWIEEEVLRPAPEDASNGFGWSITSAAGELFVGAWRNNDNRGYIYRYAFDENSRSWEQMGDLNLQFLKPGDAFGYALAGHGDNLYVGAPGYDAAGGVFVYSWNNLQSDWQISGRLRPTEPRSNGGFGGSLSASSSGVIVGGQNGGIAYVFEHQGTSHRWNSQFSLSPMGDRVDTRHFGLGVAMGDGVAVVGSPRADYEAGVATVYERGGSGAWRPTTYLVSKVGTIASITGEQRECVDGNVDLFDCQSVDLLSMLSVDDLSDDRGVQLNDLWGWTDPVTGNEYVLQGRTEGASFVDISDPYNPVYVGQLLKTEGSPGSTWRDIKVYSDHAFIVADGAGAHGMQIFDLTQLRDVNPADMPVTFEMTAHYTELNSSHNIVINEETGYAYAVGSRAGGETCGGQLHMINIQDPVNPAFAGCFFHKTPGGASSGSAHDAQCVVYRGPDAKYINREICFNSSSSSFIIADVTDKDNPVMLTRSTYPNLSYTHQGWLSEDHKFFYMNDELDELTGNVDRTRTLIWDVAELEDPVLVKEFFLNSKASDHNLYVRGNLLYQSNYQAGLRVLDITDPTNPVEAAHFDTTPFAGDEPGFGGSWSNYPFFDSGVIAVSSAQGLFLVKKQEVDL